MKKIGFTLLFLTFSGIIFSQNYSEKLSDEDLVSISKEVCDCISKIDTRSITRNDSIKECINSKLDGVSSKEKKYEQLEQELLLNCKELKKLLMLNNSRHNNSVSSNPEAVKSYNIGSDYTNNNQYEEAIPHLEKAVQIDFNFAYAWDNLGLSYRWTKQYDKAINAYENSIKIDSLGKTPIMNLGVVYEKTQQYDKAIIIYEKYVGLLENDPEGYYGLGRMYLYKKNYDLSLKNIIKAYRLYIAQGSPYKSDAVAVIRNIYQTMKVEIRKRNLKS